MLLPAKIEVVKQSLNTIQQVKKQVKRVGLDSSQLHAIEGELLGHYVISIIIGDKSYTPAPPGTANIDGSGKSGSYSIKYFTPGGYEGGRKPNRLYLNDELDFDWLLIITSDSVYRVPKGKVIPPITDGPGQPSVEAREKTLQEGLITYTSSGKKHKISIIGTDRNMEILENHYKVCENNFDFSI